MVLQLTGTKDVNNKQTLLHYIVETAETKFPDLLNFFDEMPHIDRASRVSLDTIQKTLKQMDSNIRNLQTDINNNRVPQGEDDKFLEVMEVDAVTSSNPDDGNFFFFFCCRNSHKMLESSVMSYRTCLRKWTVCIPIFPSTTYLTNKNILWRSSSAT